jgi:hypothetical protein
VLLQEVAKDIPFIAGSLAKFTPEFGNKKGPVAKATAFLYAVMLQLRILFQKASASLQPSKKFPLFNDYVLRQASETRPGSPVSHLR